MWCSEGAQFNANKLQGGGGSGLGLYITKGFVNLNAGGRIWAESEGEGHGTTFIVELEVMSVGAAIPSMIASASAAPVDYPHHDGGEEGKAQQALVAASHSQRAARILSRRGSPRGSPRGSQVKCLLPDVDGSGPGSGSGKGFRPLVLVVDDSPVNRRVQCRVLEQAGFDTAQVRDPIYHLLPSE